VRIRIWPIALGVALLGGLGPRITAPRDKKAGEPFAWEPPEGFVEIAEPIMLEEHATEGNAKLYRLSDAAGHAFVPRAQVTHTTNPAPVEESDLADIARGMPKTFSSSGVDWVERRHETRVRPDGARVGIIEGDCTRRVGEGQLFLPKGVAADVHFRKLQLVFPDDAGTSIVTIDYGSDEAARWEPIFEASIAKAKGVATRVPPPPLWMHLAWGGAGLVLGWLGASLIGSRTPQPTPAQEAEKKKSAQDKKRMIEEVDEDEDEEDDDESETKKDEKA
jgi:hypothetical protein